MTAAVESFLEALDRLDVGWTRTSVKTFPSDLAREIQEPAVGAPLPFDELSLEESNVAVRPTPGQLRDARTGVTAARLGIAEYGTLVIESAPDSTEAASLFSERHVAVLLASAVVPTMADAFERLGPMLRTDPTTAVLATGPSATADMGALVRGAHGPKEVHVFLVDDA